MVLQFAGEIFCVPLFSPPQNPKGLPEERMPTVVNRGGLKNTLLM